MRRLLILPFLLGVSLPVQAGVDPEVHQLCKDVKDYLGCVKAQTGEIKSQNKKVFGNKCPEQSAYVGEGKCQVVYCRFANIGFGQARGNDPLVGGKSNWKCGFDWFLHGQGVLQLQPEKLSITNDPKCPPGEPALGWNSTCEAPYIKKEKKKNKLPMACRNGVWAKDHPKCQLPEETVTSPMDMD